MTSPPIAPRNVAPSHLGTGVASPRLWIVSLAPAACGKCRFYLGAHCIEVQKVDWQQHLLA
jgi:hypothetical protein